MPRKSACGHDCEEVRRLRRLRRVGVRPGQQPHRRPARAEGGGGEQHQEDAADRGAGVPDPGGAVSGRLCDHLHADRQCGGAVCSGGRRIRAGHRVSPSSTTAGCGREAGCPSTSSGCSEAVFRAMCGPPLELLPPGGDGPIPAGLLRLCHTLGGRYGPAARMILNYDFTYLAILLSDPGGDGALPPPVRGQSPPAPGVSARLTGTGAGSG